MTTDTKRCYPNMDTNMWLRSCDHEAVEPIEGTTTGTIPSWINGSLIHNGPGRFQFGDHEVGHYFDGSAFLQRFFIENGTVKYQSRFIQTEVFKKNIAANRIVVTGFGTKAVPDPNRRIASYFTKPDNSLVSVYPFGDEIYAFGEYPLIHKINKENLQTEARIDFGKLISIVHHSSHPHVTEDGSVYNVGISINPLRGPHHIIVKFPKGDDMFDQATIVGKIPARWPLRPSYMHSFGITENYFVLIQQPLAISIPNLIIVKLKNDPLKKVMQWYPNKKTKFKLVSRKTGKLSYTFYSDTFFYMHIINQYEISDYLVIDICTYRNADSLEAFCTNSIKNMQKNPSFAEMFRTKPLRFVLPLKPVKTNSNLIHLEDTKAEAFYLEGGKILVKPELLADQGYDEPAINYEKYSGKPYRYFYAVGVDIDASHPGRIMKVDTYTKKSKVWSEDNCYYSEPVFVAHPNSNVEDDGVILVIVLWKDNTKRIALLVLDASTFTEIGRVEFITPGEVPRSLHGRFFPK